MRSLTLAIPALALCLLLPACRSVNSTQRADPVGQANYVDDKRVQTDLTLRRGARIISVNESVAPGDLLKIQVTLHNNRSRSKRIAYKFEWFDLDGMMVDTVMSTWQVKTIQGGEDLTLTGIAPNNRAKDFRIKIQEARH